MLKKITPAFYVLLLCLTLQAREFKPLFDGKSFAGWKAPDMSYWSIEDGAITATITPDHPCKKNQFLVWQLGELDDFVLRLKFKISGTPKANSGIQFRSGIKSDGHAVGYQADIDLAGKWAGTLYDEHTGRRALAKRGQKTVIDATGKRESIEIANADELMENLNKDGWNEYEIRAQGTELKLSINGKVTAHVIDDEKAHQDLSGKLALQLHSGPPMKIQFKDIYLKRLPLTGGRKKIVLVAGAPSHGPGEHEFNAGVKLFKKCLDENPTKLYAANYHDAGWPEDPTAFDNADAVVLYMDGWLKHAINGHLKEASELSDRGVGMMFMHYAVHAKKDDVGPQFLKFIGGYYETDWSTNPHWTADLNLNTSHPICNGVQATSITDEWYFNMRFRPGMEGVTQILSSTPTDEKITVHRRGSKWWNENAENAMNKPQILMWAAERKTGGRGVGFTGGHHHKNWANDQQRKVVLNAFHWVAGLDVPSQGFDSTLNEADMKANLDPKPVKKKKPKKRK